jgi:hypothetical protein
MVTRIVPRPIAGITNELADIDGPTTKPSAPHTLQAKVNGSKERPAIQFFKAAALLRRRVPDEFVGPLNEVLHVRRIRVPAIVLPPRELPIQ